MPQRIAPETIQAVTPDTGITVRLKSKQSYGDRKSIYSAVFGSLSVNMENPADTKITLEQAYELSSTTLFRSLVSWDLTEEDGSTTPITKASIEESLSEDDVNFLMKLIEVKPEEVKK